MTDEPYMHDIRVTGGPTAEAVPSLYATMVARELQVRSRYEPDGYTYRKVRDWRWLWLRWRTIKTPYWRPIRVTLAPMGRPSTSYLVDRDPGDEQPDQ